MCMTHVLGQTATGPSAVKGVPQSMTADLYGLSVGSQGGANVAAVAGDSNLLVQNIRMQQICMSVGCAVATLACLVDL